MAITETLLTSGGANPSPDAAGDFTTASITPSANKLILLAVTARTPSGTQPGVPTVTGCGLTWVSAATIDHDAAGTSDRSTLTLFRAMGASPTSGAVTISFGATVMDKCAWQISEFGGVDTSGTNGSGALGTPATLATASSATSGSVTLAAFGDATNNATFLAVALAGAAEGTTFEAGLTEIADDFSHGAAMSLATAWRTGEDTTPSASWTTGGRSGLIGVEIKAASGTSVVAAERTGLYDIISAAAVVAERTGVYDIFVAVVAERTGVYDIIAQVAGERTGRYDVDGVAPAKPWRTGVQMGPRDWQPGVPKNIGGRV